MIPWKLPLQYEKRITIILNNNELILLPIIAYLVRQVAEHIVV